MDVFRYGTSFLIVFSQANDSLITATVESEIPRIIQNTLPVQTNENVVKVINDKLPPCRDVLTTGTGNTLK